IFVFMYFSIKLYVLCILDIRYEILDENLRNLKKRKKSTPTIISSIPTTPDSYRDSFQFQPDLQAQILQHHIELFLAHFHHLGFFSGKNPSGYSYFLSRAISDYLILP